MSRGLLAMRAYRSLEADVEGVDVQSGDLMQSCRTLTALRRLCIVIRSLNRAATEQPVNSCSRKTV
jgi:hypothetical protein